MKSLAALMLLATLVSCAGPAPEPAGEVAVVEPGVVCRAGHNDRPVVADRGIGGTGRQAGLGSRTGASAAQASSAS